MSLVAYLLREDLREFEGYRSARSEVPASALQDGMSRHDTAWLNANESPMANAADADARLRRYPEPQPAALQRRLSGLYGCKPEQLLIGRGSDEAIDLLVRAFCAPGRDAVLVTPPVFGMYATCARLQGARLLEVPLSDGEDDFCVDLDAVARVALGQGVKVVFLCSPGNPAGAALPAGAVLALAHQLRGIAIVVVDEAYIEYSDTPSLAGMAGRQANLAVLRTLSKAHALASARIGCLIADADIIAALRHCQAPYPVPAPCAELALQALAAPVLVHTQASIAEVRSQREWLRMALTGAPSVRRVYPSQGNFLLARFADAQAALGQWSSAGIMVRDMRGFPQLGDALRITVGTPEQNRRVVAELVAAEVGA